VYRVPLSTKPEVISIEAAWWDYCRPNGPRGAHKITPEVARFIEETVALGEELSARQFAERIAEHFGVVVHQRTVKRALARLKKKAK